MDMWFSNPLFDEPVWTTNINALGDMDERAGYESDKLWAGVVLSGVSDVVSAGKFAKGLKEGKSLLEAGKDFWPFSVPKDASDIPGTLNTINTLSGDLPKQESIVKKAQNVFWDLFPVNGTLRAKDTAESYKYRYTLSHGEEDNVNYLGN